MKTTAQIVFLGCSLAVVSCEKLDLMIRDGGMSPDSVEAPVSLKDVAMLLSAADLESEQVSEVYDAAARSRENGYDEEYTMKNIFCSPGAGVGDEKLKSTPEGTVSKTYTRPLREVFERYYSSSELGTKASSGSACLEYLRSSDIQIYVPYSELWDGKTRPVITFAPTGEASTNTGWYTDEKGELQEVVVTEEMARRRPVWVINNNDDASFTSLEMVRKLNPEWTQGGALVIESKSSVNEAPVLQAPVFSVGCKTLILKEFTMLRNYDNWFAGASEFFIKIASVNDFTASTEAELYLYDPSVTDFMVVIKRNQLGIPQDLCTVLVSEWTQQLQSCAFMIVEDDGGTWTSWDCSAVVKYNSRSYGFDVKIPFRSRDDIVWRGSLGRKYIESTTDLAAYFGDVSLVFSIADL